MEVTLEAPVVNSITVTSLGSVCYSLWRKGEGDTVKQTALRWTHIAASPDVVLPEGQQSSGSASRKCGGTSVLT